MQRHEANLALRVVQQELHDALLTERAWLQAMYAWPPRSLTALLAPPPDGSRRK